MRISSKEVGEYFFVGLLVLAVLLPILVASLGRRFPESRGFQAIDGLFFGGDDHADGGDYGDFGDGGGGGD